MNITEIGEIVLLGAGAALFVGHRLYEFIDDLPRNGQWKRLGIVSPTEGLPVFYCRHKHSDFTWWRYCLHDDMNIEKTLRDRRDDIAAEFGKGKPVKIVRWSEHLIDIYVEQYAGASDAHQYAIRQRPRVPGAVYMGGEAA